MRAKHVGHVEQRLPHPHEHHVGHSRPEVLLQRNHLVHDLVRREVTRETPLPVAQNVHRIGQPTCEETHAVSLFFPFSVAGMPTASTTRLSSRRRRSFATPSVAAATWCTLDRPTVTPSERSDSRATFGRVVRSSTPRGASAVEMVSELLSPKRGHASVRGERLELGEGQAQQRERAGGRGVTGGGRERSKVALASSWDSTTRRASRSFHSPS